MHYAACTPHFEVKFIARDVILLIRIQGFKGRVIKQTLIFEKLSIVRLDFITDINIQKI